MNNDDSDHIIEERYRHMTFPYGNSIINFTDHKINLMFNRLKVTNFKQDISDGVIVLYHRYIIIRLFCDGIYIDDYEIDIHIHIYPKNKFVSICGIHLIYPSTIDTVPYGTLRSIEDIRRILDKCHETMLGILHNESICKLLK